jgi:hypothetical protein
MRNIIVMSFAVAGCVNAPQTQHEASATAPPVGQAKPATPETTGTETSAPLSQDLADLDAMTFDCPRAGLNAAARVAAKVPSQGTYQFSYFKIVNDAHHATYEVHFKSNYVGEPELRYCVSMYCQQGWDPRNTKIDVALMSDEQASRSTCGMHAAFPPGAHP